MIRSRSLPSLLLCILWLPVLVACGGGESGDVGSVGGDVKSLTADGLLLELDAGSTHDQVAVPANASGFAFDRLLLEGTHYSVSVKEQPQGQNCTVSSGEGDMGSSPVRNVVVFCGTDCHAVGGTVSGLAPGQSVVLQLNGITRTVTATGTSPVEYTFDEAIPAGASYLVTVKSEPDGRSCATTTVSSSGTMPAGDVTDADVVCQEAGAAVKGIVVGLVGSGLKLQLNRGSDLSLPAGATHFEFPGVLTEGSSYTVSVLTNPSVPSQTCLLKNPQGAMPADGVDDVMVTCSTNSYYVRGTYSTTWGNPVGATLSMNGQTITLSSSSTSFAFPNPIPSGTHFEVTAVTTCTGSQPITLTNAAGVVGGSDVTNVSVGCEPLRF